MTNAMTDRMFTEADGATGRFYGCLFCATGEEDKAMAGLRKRVNLSAIAPVRLCYHLSDGVYSIRRKSLFPGYLFFRVEDPDIPVWKLESTANVLRLLKYDDDTWVLNGDDADLAAELFRHDGVIGFSKARMVDGRLKIIDGFLKPYENKIIKVDKRHRVANVELMINHRPLNVWLGYDIEGAEIRAGDSVYEVPYKEGDRVCVVDGLLKDSEGVVVRVWRREKAAEVRIEREDKHLNARLEFELIQKI